ncbi:hypothetical protein Pse7367_2479 [Thalassoporum mexicanum PCC 7367]|uniref:hypothetical protein n=1 Tax=Thalassoporum mexicanum TaxID=3457544 RepID=UPI00029F8435|nr:hypothetical protein [Pseudanabaena sp. PCC 7367]AFY70739.1 hypothetical protein Pse7367_2479 [Pseudanabaena sp. PCC 7367]
MHSDRLSKIILTGLTIFGVGAISPIATINKSAQADIIPVETNQSSQSNPNPNNQPRLILIPVESKPSNPNRSPQTKPAPSRSIPANPADPVIRNDSPNDRANPATLFAGTWQGRVIQKDVDAPPYLVVINFEAAKPVAVGDRLAKIDYPDLQCGGYLTVIEVRGDRLRAKEKIDYGTRQCVDGGLVTLKPEQSSLGFDWTYSANPNESIVNGSLTQADR